MEKEKLLDPMLTGEVSVQDYSTFGKNPESKDDENIKTFNNTS